MMRVQCTSIGKPGSWPRVVAGACVGVAAWAALAGAAEPPVPVAVAARFLGPEGQDLGAERFAAAVSRAGLPARAATARAASWREPAATAAPWLAGVTAGFGERAHAYAFAFDPAGAVTRFAHVPYGKSVLQGGTRVWIAPFNGLAAAIAAESGRPPRSGPAVGIRVVREQASAEAGRVADPQVFEAIAWAAACEAGWTPTPAAAATTATVSVEAGVKSVSFRLTIESGGSRRELRKRSVSEDDVHEVLRRMFACGLPNAMATDFLRIGADGVLVAAMPGRLVCTTADGLRDFDTASCRGTWADDEPARASRAGGGFVPWRAADGAVRIIRWQPGLAAIDPATGAAAKLATLQPASNSSFDLAEGRAAVASGTVVAAFAAGREIWRHAAADRVTCGPAYVGGLVVAGTDEGDLFALDGSAGAVAWRQRLDPQLVGRPTVVGPHVVVFSRSTNALVAVAADTGRTAWSQPLDDVPVNQPVATPAGLCVATKSNVVLLLDPATGRPRAERRLSGWIGDTALLSASQESGGRIACLTRDGGISLLDAATLEPVGDHRLPTRPGYRQPTRLLVAEKFPVAWPGPRPPAAGDDELEDEFEAELGDTATCLVAADEDGYAWIIPTTRLAERRR